MSKHTRDVPFALAEIIDNWHPERIVACVQAMSGISDPSAVPEMLEVLKQTERTFGDRFPDVVSVIDKVTGRKSCEASSRKDEQ